MDLHEYQSKAVLAKYHVPVPMSMVIRSKEEAKDAYQKLGPVVVGKAQVLTGGRGKAGGVELVKSEKDLLTLVDKLLDKNLVTYQTTDKGLPVNSLLVEKAVKITSELYLAFLIDRTNQVVTIMASTEGGVEIEKVASETPDKIHKVFIKTDKLEDFQCRELGFALGFSKELVSQFSILLKKLYHAFIENDMSMLEVNPLIIDGDKNLLCLDCKVNIDDNALYRQAELAKLRDTTQEDSKEVEAGKYDLNYIALEGAIGCMVNGAGLAMATMDMIKICGGMPANFLDVGGTATEDRVTEAFKIIEQDKNVKVIFVNIFGGMVRGDLIADGILNAVKVLGLNKPVVVRLVGNNADKGNKLLSESEYSVEAMSNFKEAAERAVALSEGKK